MPDERHARARHPSRMNASRERRQARWPRQPIAASASRRSEAPTATKKTTSTGGAPRWTAAFSASPCATDRFSITSPAATAASSGSNCCVAADLAEQRAHREQHQRHLASDVAQIQREQRADQAAERDRAADLPREAHEHADAVARRRCQTPRAQLHREREQHEQHEIGEHDDRRAPVSLRRPRAPVSVVTAAVIVGEKLTDHDASSTTIASARRPPASGATGSHGHASQHHDTDASMATASVMRRHAHDGREWRPSRSKLSVRPAINAISVVAMPVTTCSCAAIDSVMTLPSWADEHAEQEVAGQARQPETAQHIAGDPGADQREAERESSACSA